MSLESIYVEYSIFCVFEICKFETLALICDNTSGDSAFVVGWRQRQKKLYYNPFYANLFTLF